MTRRSGWIGHCGAHGVGVARPFAMVVGASMLLAGAVPAAGQQDGGADLVASALGVPAASIHIGGLLDPIVATDPQLYRVGGGDVDVTPGIAVEQAAAAWLDPLPDGAFATLQADGGPLDCDRATVACPASGLRVARFDAGGALFAWDLVGAVERPAGDQILRIAILAHDPRFPTLTDERPDSPFPRVNKIWVMDITPTDELMRYYQADGAALAEFRGDAIGGFTADRGFTLVDPALFDGVTEWNVHTYLVGGSDEGGHSLVPPGDGMVPVTGTTVSIEPVPPEPCAPRPPIRVTNAAVGAGVLEVTISTDGALSGVEVGSGSNWVIEQGTPISVPAGATEVTFRVRRTAPGSVHVPITVTDACGPWRTFVGGGANAF